MLSVSHSNVMQGYSLSVSHSNPLHGLSLVVSGYCLDTSITLTLDIYQPLIDMGLRPLSWWASLHHLGESPSSIYISTNGLLYTSLSVSPYIYICIYPIGLYLNSLIKALLQVHLFQKARPISWAIIKYINLVLELNITY